MDLIAETLATFYTARLKCVRLDITQKPSATATKYNIGTGVPAYIIFKGGQVASTGLGVVPNNEFL